MGSKGMQVPNEKNERKKRLRKNVKLRQELKEKEKEIQQSINELNLLIEKDLEVMDDLYEAKTFTAKVIRPEPTNYNIPLLQEIINSRLKKSQKEKLIESKIVYKVNEKYLLDLINNKHLPVKEVRKAVDSVKGKPYVRITPKK